ncbi:MAG: hypothetical protein ACREE6_18215, partial [Limisphaerales bacterium]
MKQITHILLVLALTVPMLRAQAQPALPGLPGAQKNSDNQIIPKGMIYFEGVDVRQVLDVYAGLVNKTL